MGRSSTEGPFSIAYASARVADLIRRRAHYARVHVVGLPLGGQVALQLLGTVPELLHDVIVSGTLVRPGGLMIALAKLYMPFRNNEILVRANIHKLGIPIQYFTEFREYTRLLSGAALAHILHASLSFRIPPGLNN
jgi:pimeloyl-ACP methyl ester carboxylesterase